RPLGEQEAIGRDAQRSVMMEATPSAPFIVTKPDLLLEFLIIALDTPAQLGKVDEAAEADVCRQRREPVFGRLGLAMGPLDQQPLLQQQFRDQLIMPDTDAHACKARSQPIGRTFPPPDRAPGALGQTKRHLFGRDQIRLVAPPGIVQRLFWPPRGGAGWAPPRNWLDARPLRSAP